MLVTAGEMNSQLLTSWQQSQRPVDHGPGDRKFSAAVVGLGILAAAFMESVAAADDVEGYIAEGE